MTAPINNGTASGPVFRADMFGVRGLAHYYLTQGQLQPYLGFGIGGAWNYSYQQVSDVADSQEKLQASSSIRRSGCSTGSPRAARPRR